MKLQSMLDAIPKRCFQKKPLLGTLYIVRDFLLWFASYVLFENSSKNLMECILYWNLSGFIMWCLFVDGHDCGHGTFSDSNILNTIFGHICHTPLLVPYSTWAESHRRHHLGHNHIYNDYSHKWIEYKKDKILSIRLLQKSNLIPFVGFFLYLLGFGDGGHWIPFGGKLWNNNNHHIHSVFSSSLVFTFLYTNFYNYTFTNFMMYYGFSWIMFSFWLVTVTYLQHHDNRVEDTIVYGDDSWNHVVGALQTVDRSYGNIIDNMSHNITNGHLVHHLFTRIPHYHLEEATQHLYKYLDENKIPHKYFYTPDFFIKIFQLTYNHFGEAIFKK